MACEAAKFDDQCDLAALVFDRPDEPDRLLREFVHELAARGHRVVGLIQTRLGEGGAAVTVLPTGETIALAPRIDALSNPSCSAPCDLRPAAARIDALIESDADLLIINRFGKLEAEGTGLVDEIARAVRLDIPVVVAVPDFRFLEWLSFCKGMGVKLPCRSGSLRRWWNAMIVGGQRPERLAAAASLTLDIVPQISGFGKLKLTKCARRTHAGLYCIWHRDRSRFIMRNGSTTLSPAPAAWLAHLSRWRLPVSGLY